MFNSEASCDEEVKSRLAIARQRLSELVPIWKSRTVSNKLKGRLIKALVWPIVTYGSEAWTLNKELCEIRWTYDERGGFRKGRPRQGPVGASEITQTEILRSHNETWKFREGHHAGHHARKTLARWSEETVDRWYHSMEREKPGRNGKTGGEQKRLPVLSSWSRLRSYIGHGKLMMMTLQLDTVN